MELQVIVYTSLIHINTVGCLLIVRHQLEAQNTNHLLIT